MIAEAKEVYNRSSLVIFVKGLLDMPDEEILTNLGLKNFVEVSLEDSSVIMVSHVRIARNREWTIIGDGLRFCLVLEDGIFDTIEALGSQFDLFYYTMGDADYSYAFASIRQGQIIRKKILEYPNWVDEEILADIGIPDPAELLMTKDHIHRDLPLIAQAFGVDVSFDSAKIYEYPDDPRLQ